MPGLTWCTVGSSRPPGAGDVDYALAEQLLGLLSPATGQVVAGPTPGMPEPTIALVAAARAAIAEGHPASDGLFSLAELAVVPSALPGRAPPTRPNLRQA